MTQPNLYAAKALIAAITNSDSANSFCRNLVHTVFTRFGVNSAVVCTIGHEARLHPIGSYGIALDFLDGDLGSAFAVTPIAKAIKNHDVVVFPSLGDEMAHIAEAAGLSPENGAVAIPLVIDGLVCGATMLTFDTRLEVNPLEPELCEGLQVASAYFVNSNGHEHANGWRRASEVSDVPKQLTDRQLEILKQLGLPITYSQIGRQLHVSESLVKQESGRIFRFFGVNSRRDAVREAQERHVIPASSE